MRAAVTFAIGDWHHSLVVENSDDPEATVRALLKPGTLLTDVLDERFGAHPNTARRLDEIQRAKP